MRTDLIIRFLMSSRSFNKFKEFKQIRFFTTLLLDFLLQWKMVQK